MSLTPKQLEIRRQGITGTDIAAILGKHPYRSAIDVWMDKMGLADPVEETMAIKMGNKLEPIVAELYSEHTGRALQTVPDVLSHATNPLFKGTPDRLVVGEPMGLEIKTAGWHAAKDFGEAGTDEVPTHYLLQCTHYMAVTDLPVWDLAVLIDGRTFHIYTIRRDRDLEAAVLARAAEWWERHIVGNTPPPIDGSASSSDYLSKRFPSNDGVMLTATPDAVEWAAALREAKLALALAETSEAEAGNHLRALIGDADGVQGDGWKITWKKNKDGSVVDWESIVGELRTHLEQRGMSNEALNDIVLSHTRTKPGPRVLRANFNAKEKAKR